MSLRNLPSVDRLLTSDAGRRLVDEFGREWSLQALRTSLGEVRQNWQDGQPLPDAGQLVDLSRQTLQAWLEPGLVPVINATGVILHTNLGRAPLAATARQELQSIAAGYSNLEYDLPLGQRSSREQLAAHLLARLTGAEDALVVNNNAAAVLLALTALAAGRDALISRTQLIEIGGGFRIPEVLDQSGARLVEVGTTNRTHLADFERALSPATAVVLRAHSSNFRLVGFTTEPDLAELAGFCRRAGLCLIDDLGSGALMDTAEFGLAHEPMVQESVQAGADLVAFSGDKLLGGPQAGILVGRADLIARLRKHPLARAVRPDKLCLAALIPTLAHYARGEAALAIPVWQMIAAQPAALEQRAQAWRQQLGLGQIVDGESTVGGGSLPGEMLPTRLLQLPADRPDELAAGLRLATPAVIARIQDDRVLLDPRSVLPEQDPALLAALRTTLGRLGQGDPR